MTDATPPPNPAADPAARQAADDRLAAMFDQLATRYIEQNAAGEDSAAMHLGISRKMLADYMARSKVSKDELHALTTDDAKRILYERVWRPLGGDKLPPEVTAMLFQLASEKGVEYAGKLLQKAVSSATGARLNIDGAVGVQTLMAIAKADPLDIISQIVTRKSTLLSRIGDGKIFGRDPLVFLQDAAVFAVKLYLTKGL